jgi:hypothetical protein
VFPDDDDLSVQESGPYQARSRIVLLREVPEHTAASLAGLVPGRAGVILYMIARGDTRHDVAEMLKIPVDDVDAVLRDQSGQHMVRPDG